MSCLGFRLGTDSSFIAKAVMVPLGKHSEEKEEDQTLIRVRLVPPPPDTNILSNKPVSVEKKLQAKENSLIFLLASGFFRATLSLLLMEDPLTA